MGVYLDSDVRHALEVLGTASTGVRLTVAAVLIRQSVVDPAVGLVGKGFLRETEGGLLAVLDWMAVGTDEALRDTTTKEMETEEVSL